jgi:hypothetical protein
MIAAAAKMTCRVTTATESIARPQASGEMVRWGA